MLQLSLANHLSLPIHWPLLFPAQLFLLLGYTDVTKTMNYITWD